MAEVSGVINLGIGPTTTADIEQFILVGLNVGAAAAPSVASTTSDYLRAMQSALQASGYFSAVTIGEPDA